MKFREVPGFPDYECSKSGVVRSIDRTKIELRNGRPTKRFYKGKVLKPYLYKQAPGCYYKVCLFNEDGKFSMNIHTVVAMTWSSKYNRRYKVELRNHNRKNYQLDNLIFTDIEHRKS